MRPRLYLDEDVVPELARLLRAIGEDVISAHEIGALELTDEEQLTRASASGRAILTYNYTHFYQLASAWFLAARPHAGIIVSYHQYRRDELGALRQAVLRLLNSLDVEILENSVQVLDPFRTA